MHQRRWAVRVSAEPLGSGERMRLVCLAVALASLMGCSDPAERAELARASLADGLPLGTPIDEVKAHLQGRASSLREFTREECGEFVYEPRFQCAGGPAVFATLYENVQPWHPIVRTDVEAFLAFNQERELAHVDVYLETSDR
jgi:hypothetical protein